MINSNSIKNNFFLFFFVIFIFFFQINTFESITPHHDQTFHISWFLKLKNSDHFLPNDFLINLKSLAIDTNGFVHELFKPASNPGDYHAYLFQINSVLTVYLFSLILNVEPIKLYIFVSVFFSSLSIVLNYKILIIILNKYSINKNTFLDNFIYQFIFCLLNLSFYKFFFSPLGHHNIGNFFFSLVIFILLNEKLSNSKIFPYLMGLTLGLVSFFQITIVLLLLPLISCFFLFQNFQVSLKNFIDFLKFSLVYLIFCIPFLILIINDIFFSNINFSINDLSEANILGGEIYLKKIIFWIKKFFNLGYPIIFFGFFISLYISFKTKKFILIQFIILIHFIINIFLSIFYGTYLRNFYYIYNIFLILTSFSLIYFYQKNYFIKLFTIFLILTHFAYNSKFIFNFKKLEEVEPLFYQLYFEDNGKLKNKIIKTKQLVNENFVFFSDFSKNYFTVYDYDFVKNRSLTLKPLYNLANNLDRNDEYSKIIVKNFDIIDQDFNIISIGKNFENVLKTINKLQKSNLIDKKCTVEFPHLQNEPIFRDSGTGKYDYLLYLTKLNC